MTMPLSRTDYRPDVDALRAIAVLSVVMYHFGIGPFNGGFVGVDVFFVISGYLITGIIHKEVGAGEFTFANFYERRARRIFPALFVMLLVVMLAAPFVLLPSDFSRLGESVIATLIFGSNILFWQQSGYFDPSSQLNPLLHTWSLSVEEQFYIGFPILMLLIERYARRQIVPILMLVTAISFALCLYFQPLRPTATFYLSPFRAWELMLGALLAVGAVPAMSYRPARELVAGVALMTLLASLILLEEGPSFPGWIATLPVLATAALLHTGASGDSLVRRALTLRPLVLVGLISYSLYLWHWPLVVYLKYANGMEELPVGSGYLLLAVSVLVAWASYRWVEAPFRRRRSGILPATRNGLFAMALACIAGLGLLAASSWINQGWRDRFPNAVAAMDRQRYPKIPYKHCDPPAPSIANAACIGGAPNGTSSILLWGDSHGLAWSPALDIIGKRAAMKVFMSPNSACPPLFDVSNPHDPTCIEENDRVRDYVRVNRPDVVVMIASWPAYSIPQGFYTLEDRQGRKDNSEVFAPALIRTIAELRPYVRQIILVGPTPGAPGDSPFLTAISLWKSRPMPPRNSLREVRERDYWFWQAVQRLDGGGKLHLVDPVPWFCNQAKCGYTSTDNQGQVMLLYRDSSHLSLAGAEFVAEHFSLRFSSIRQQKTR
jgi:peptidoglycan/LPS O-acetylase OafA/YrhL